MKPARTGNLFRGLIHGSVSNRQAFFKKYYPSRRRGVEIFWKTAKRRSLTIRENTSVSLPEKGIALTNSND